MAQRYAAPFGANQGRIYKITATGDRLTADTTDPTYANGDLIACLQSLGWDFEMINVEQEGNDTVCDVFSKTKNLTFELGIGGLDLDLYETFLGVTATDFGDGSYVDITKDDVRGEFGIIVKAINSSGGDTHIVLFRCTAQEGPGNGFEQGGHHDESWSGIARESYYGDGVFARIIHHTTAESVPAVWPGNAAY